MHDDSALSTRGPDWFTDGCTRSAGPKSLLTMVGAEHVLGGISGYAVAETTDEDPQRVAVVQRATTATSSTPSAWTASPGRRCAPTWLTAASRSPAWPRAPDRPARPHHPLTAPPPHRGALSRPRHHGPGGCPSSSPSRTAARPRGSSEPPAPISMTCDPPVNISALSAQAWAALGPGAVATAPKEIPQEPEATPTDSA